MKLLTRALAGALLIAACAAAPASAHRAWLPPEPLAGDGSQPEIAVAGQGDVFATWVEHSGAGFDVRAAIKQPGQAPQIQTLGTHSAGGLSPIAADGDGNALVAWESTSGPDQLARRAAGGTFGTPTDLPAGEVVTGIVTNASGQAAIVYLRWPSQHLSLDVSFGSTTGSFSTPVPLAEDAEAGYDLPRLRMTPSGEVIAAWSRRESSHEDGTIMTAIRGPGDAAPTVQTLSAPGFDAGYEFLSVDSTGAAILTWKDGSSDDSHRIAERDPGQPFGPARALGTGGSGEASAAIAGDGTITAFGNRQAWRGSLHNPLTAINDKRFEPAYGIAPYANGGNRVMFAWSTGWDDAGHADWVSVARDGDGELGPIEDVDPSCQGSDYVFPAIGSGGDAAALLVRGGTLGLTVDAPASGATNQRCGEATDYNGYPPLSVSPPYTDPGPPAQGPTPVQLIHKFRLELGKVIVRRTSRSRTVVVPIDCAVVCFTTTKATLRVHGGKTIGSTTKKTGFNGGSSGRVSVQITLTKAGRKLVARYPRKLELVVKVSALSGSFKTLHKTATVRTK